MAMKQKRIEIDEIVLLNEQRVGIVRFKGLVKFSIGEWFGLEMLNTTTRHDGMIDGVRYFRCSRNRGLFVRRSVIKQIIPPMDAQKMKRVFHRSNVRDTNNNNNNNNINTNINITPVTNSSTTPSSSSSSSSETPRILMTGTPIVTTSSSHMTISYSNIDSKNKIKVKPINIKNKQQNSKDDSYSNINNNNNNNNNKNSSKINNNNNNNNKSNTPTSSKIRSQSIQMAGFNIKSITDIDSDGDGDGDGDDQEDIKKKIKKKKEINNAIKLIKKNSIGSNNNNNNNNNNNKNNNNDDSNNNNNNNRNRSHSAQLIANHQHSKSVTIPSAKLLFEEPPRISTLSRKKNPPITTKRKGGNSSGLTLLTTQFQQSKMKALKESREQAIKMSQTEKDKDTNEQKTTNEQKDQIEKKDKDMTIETETETETTTRPSTNGHGKNPESPWLSGDPLISTKRKAFGMDPVFTRLDRKRNRNSLEDELFNLDLSIDPTTPKEKENQSIISPHSSKVLHVGVRPTTESKTIPSNWLSPTNSTSPVSVADGATQSPTTPSEQSREQMKKVSSELMQVSTGEQVRTRSKTRRTQHRRVNSILSVYEKYPAAADYPNLAEYRNETLIADIMDNKTYDKYRDVISSPYGYTLDDCIQCACFFIPDPIGFRLGDPMCYDLYSELIDQLLHILHCDDKENESTQLQNTLRYTADKDWTQLIKHDRKYNSDVKIPKDKNNLPQLSKLSALKEWNFRSRSKSVQPKGPLLADHQMPLPKKNTLDQKSGARKSPQSGSNKNSKNPNNRAREINSGNQSTPHRPDKSVPRIKTIRSKPHISQSTKNIDWGINIMDSKYVLGCRVHLSRNIHGFRFSTSITRAERRQVEKMLSSILSTGEGIWSGRYQPYQRIDPQKLPLLIAADQIFPKPDAPGLVLAGYARDWPESRGIFVNDSKTLHVWVNYLEHVHILSVQNNVQVVKCLQRALEAEKILEEAIRSYQRDFIRKHCQQNGSATNEKESKETDLKEGEEEEEEEEDSKFPTGFVCHSKIGYLTSSPQFFGTGMRVFIKVKLPLLMKHPQFESILEAENLTAYQPNLNREMFKTSSNLFQEFSTVKTSKEKISPDKITTTKEQIPTQEDTTETTIKQPQILPNDNNIDDRPYSGGFQKLHKDSTNVGDDIPIKKHSTWNSGGAVDDWLLEDISEQSNDESEMTLFQTVSLGVTEVSQLQQMISATNRLIDKEKLLEMGRELSDS